MVKFHIVLGSHISFQLSCFVEGLFTLKKPALHSYTFFISEKNHPGF